MFGYITADTTALTEEQSMRYRSCYCGLCRALRLRHGGLSRLTLNYDMTFLILLLNSLYEPEEQRGKERCIVHPLKRHGYWESVLTDYAADMNIALAYHNGADDWRDEHKLTGLTEQKLLEKHYAAVREKYKRQCESIEKNLFELSWLEEQKCGNPDRGASYFGALMGELFLYREDNWAKTLRSMGENLGRFIYIMDACLDMDGDRAHSRYNPLLAFQDAGGDLSDIKEILAMLIGRSAQSFEKLPLLLDVDLLRNILYSGVWQRYTISNSEKKQKLKPDGEETKHDE
jgi:hypothetical protein